MKSILKNPEGFTLIELLTIIAIIGFIACGGIYYFNNAKAKASIAKGLTFSQSLNDTIGSEAVGSWNFNEGTGNIARDAAGNGNDGTLVNFTFDNNSGWTEKNPSLGYALQFDGSSSYVDCGNKPNLDVTDELTISMWIYPMAEEDGYANHPIEKWSGTSDANYVLYYFGTTSGSNRQIRFYANAGGAWKPISPLYTLSLKNWHHIVLSYSSSKGGYLYVNGVRVKGVAGSGKLAVTPANLKIGADFAGLIDDVRIYNQSFNISQINKIYSEACEKYAKNI